jgi:hypothetical protein
MTHEQKRVWIRLVIAVAAYVTYVVTILTRADGRALPDVPYAGTLLWTIVAAVSVGLVAEVVLRGVGSEASRVKDVRDREIERFGDATGQSFVAIGSLAAMLMAMARWDQFWIANVICLCSVVALVLSSIAKIVMYGRSLPQW